jgi:hypothetical protein
MRIHGSVFLGSSSFVLPRPLPAGHDGALQLASAALTNLPEGDGERMKTGNRAIGCS